MSDEKKILYERLGGYGAIAAVVTDPRWYEKNVMGAGPFKFVEYVRGSHWVGKKNPDYWNRGKPYLDDSRTSRRGSGSSTRAARWGSTSSR
jgi:ABC-type transport system substrate-binding protein